MGDLNPAEPPHFLERDGLPRLAFRFRPGLGPAILFLPGYASDMTGSKAEAIDSWAAETGRAMLRFDYAGCGESEGRFDSGTLASWRDDALAMVDASEGDLVLVGSSMGGWLMLLVAIARPDRVRALIGIASAPDFSDWGYDQDEKMRILQEGRIEQPSAYGPPMVTTRAFWQSAESQRLLHAPIPFDGPVRLLHGEADPEVPTWVSQRVAALVRSADVQTILVKDGDHRLSRPQDIALLLRTLDTLLESL
ncbi:alpha/beta fold hydrolase [Sphingomonas oryzagri]|uniref:Palmitoyl-protein thioesterase ABHD10, mitochondrial n=1 Tax=Sphingomonas oryzagri TaxID=3042314 RepID=A0ABT6N4Z3_9SPHN|nr:alpha/beta hydrolase [Sphingomonas oryzagri]MDH7640174.1 alpha/beta hydrolase [Sphingomonas oryzagri]